MMNIFIFTDQLISRIASTYPDESPQKLHQWPLHNPKLAVLHALSNSCVIGPYLFWRCEENRVTVNVDHYADRVNNLLAPKMNAIPNTENLWLQQHEAMAHTAQLSMAAVCRLFMGHVISKFEHVHWLSCSDISPPDFFLWVLLKRCYILWCWPSCRRGAWCPPGPQQGAVGVRTSIFWLSPGLGTYHWGFHCDRFKLIQRQLGRPPSTRTALFIEYLRAWSEPQGQTSLPLRGWWWPLGSPEPPLGGIHK